MHAKTISILMIILLLAGLTVYLAFSDKEFGVESVGCIMDALGCPDGSFVGRTGPKCKFSACPNQESFIGTLRQSSSGFDLILPAPEGPDFQEVSYVMPIVFRVSDSLADFIGKRVRVIGEFISGNILQVANLEPVSGDEGNPELGRVKVGESVFINGVNITLNKIVQDSRCPIDVVCVWAGNVTVNVTLRSDTDTETLDMVSDAVAKALDSFQISIQEVLPLQSTSVETSDDDYSVVFMVKVNQ